MLESAGKSAAGGAQGACRLATNLNALEITESESVFRIVLLLGSLQTVANCSDDDWRPNDSSAYFATSPAL